ncbi:ABC transporter ATP-binding protein [Alicyclobacillus macrosporangiidus]|uniref:Energy-coupling factor transport system ATP-binding protein n=1 Tax=Alicyclobacillus macrosporangiidus TaxID=392015 RepID=A0A1I7JPD8_9BACL|nr:ABC transporter ATP-binding protein [Alicyclobacillus macrosporangiidus]SFU86986.1 energy-coupling factor transport system ATP-binding protein [Alicyclobacillus macrosporangiidus]
MLEVQVEGLTYTYPGAPTPALQEVSLTVPPGTWLLLHGDTGSGKSTLLKCLSGACPAFYGGTMAGRVRIGGLSPQAMSAAERVHRIGVVYQDPEAQQVHATVAREVAFTLENLGVPPREMGWRVAEALAMVGLSDRAGDPVASLSGGLRQRVALAAALVHQPGVLLLDEPASQIDPVAAEELWDVLRRLRDDFGLTLVMSEHRVDRLYGWVDQVAVLSRGRLVQLGPPREVAAWLREAHPDSAPVLARLWPASDVPALTVREVRQRIRQELRVPGGEGGHLSGGEVGRRKTPVAETVARTEAGAGASRELEDIVIGVERAVVLYPPSEVRALDECTAGLVRGRVTALIGPNGAGKSTLLRVWAGLQPLASGRLTGVLGGLRGDHPPSRRARSRFRTAAANGETAPPARVAFLPQNPNDLLSQETVEEELGLSLRLQGADDARTREVVAEVARGFGIHPLLPRHPRDLSGGERMRVALAALAVAEPELLLLDEPTRGLDPAQKQALGRWLRTGGRTVAVATHDLEFVAEFADRVLFVDQGQVVLSGTPGEVFRAALWFAPVLARALRGVAPGILCLADAVAAGWAR